MLVGYPYLYESKKATGLEASGLSFVAGDWGGVIHMSRPAVNQDL